MKSYLSSDYTHSARTRSVQGDWHEIITGVIRVARVFEENGDTREAAQLYAYHNTLNQHASRHLERVANGQNGHSEEMLKVTHGHGLPLPNPPPPPRKDSPPETEQGLATADETVALHKDDSRVEELSIPPCAPNGVAVVPTANLEDRIQTLIAQMEDAMVKHPDHQGYEVAIKMLHRARSLAREGKEELAERQLRAAENAAGDAKEMGVT